MKSAVSMIVTVMFCTACSATGFAEPVRARPSQAFSLKVGESARTADGAWVIGFDGVPADSRCPKGEQCVWAGDATVRVWTQRPGGPKQMRELHTAPSAPRAGDTPGGALRLVRLDPTPITGKAIAQRDYVATLALDGADAPGAAPER
ncbi:MAG: hypothetical protein ABIQ60_15405 [Burkholderiaceae bacterium]